MLLLEETAKSTQKEHGKVKQGNDGAGLFVNQVKVEFTAKALTAYGGLAALVGALLEAIDLRAFVARYIPIVETSPNSGGVYEKVLGQFLTVLVGGRRFAHALWWGHGVEALRAALGVSWLPAAGSTLTRFWGKINTWSLAERVGEGARTVPRRLMAWEGIDADTLNLDSHVATRYGRQEGARKGYNPKKPGRPSHHPLIAFTGTGYIANLWNRAGNAFAGSHAVEFFQQAVAALGESFRVTRVLCDSGFYLLEFLEYLEKHAYPYVIAVRLYDVLQREIYAVRDWTAVDDGIEVASFFFCHADPKWTTPRRYVVVRQALATRPTAAGKQLALFEDDPTWGAWRYSAFVTNDPDSPAETIWRNYRPRACDENVIKDLVEGYGLAAFNLHSFWATEAVMVLNALVFHNLLLYLTRTLLKSPDGPVHQLKTVRSQYFILPGQLGTAGRALVLRLGVREKALRAKITYCLQRLARLPRLMNGNAVGT